MKNISIIIPVHVWDEDMKSLLGRALGNLDECRGFYDGELRAIVVGPQAVVDGVHSDYCDRVSAVLLNEGSTDFCSQVNFAAQNIDTDYFSIMEVDDVYAPKWFKMFNEYLAGRENVSLFLPVNVQKIVGDDSVLFVNEIALSGSFSSNIGHLDEDALLSASVYNVTGGVFKTADFVKAGMYKPSIKVSFNYELLLRMAHKKMDIMVVPKEGYLHVVGRKDSLSDLYVNTLSNDEVAEWYALAKKEYVHEKDRNKGIGGKKKSVELK